MAVDLVALRAGLLATYADYSEFIPAHVDALTASLTALDARTDALEADMALKAPLTTTATLSSRADALEAGQLLKAPKESPTFTGSPAAPTPVYNSNTTLLATTAFATQLTGFYSPLSCQIGASSATGTPASATVRLGNAVSASVTICNIHYTDTLGVDRSAKWKATIKVGSLLLINDGGTPTDWILVQVTAVTDNTTWMATTVTFVAGSSATPSGASFLTVVKIG
ncbi:hypothetical protein [Mesorhizobium sp. CN2-181]|uniref:hypothetical protein n=1 Tax=Mesorhizobium yinganensis TaxID=3157707 RepID=UPI0032B82818